MNGGHIGGCLLSAKQRRRAFGSDDRPTFQHCGGPMHLIRRGLHSDFGAAYERQTFLCPKCNVEIKRSADKQGQQNRDIYGRDCAKY
jgi:hypothetical protein